MVPASDHITHPGLASPEFSLSQARATLELSGRSKSRSPGCRGPGLPCPCLLLASLDSLPLSSASLSLSSVAAFTSFSLSFLHFSPAVAGALSSSFPHKPHLLSWPSLNLLCHPFTLLPSIIISINPLSSPTFPFNIIFFLFSGILWPFCAV